MEHEREAEGYQMVQLEEVEVAQLAQHQLSPDIVWRDVSFDVGGKAILTSCWGKVEPGQVCAIMGPSGAGKSSLLNVLAGRSMSSIGLHVEGKVAVGGKLINPVTYRQNIAYVMQDDALLATVTPREALQFSATMRLPSSLTQQNINDIVEKLIVDLTLTKCADTLIGSEMVKGISGGERKRTSVGVELVTDPKLLFLDEPTSGLDSYSAVHMVGLLRTVAAAHCTVLCTCHQPSSLIFFMFDTVIFMKDGRIFYQGPSKEAARYFAGFGYVCPRNYNPSDFIMSLCQRTASDELQVKGMFMNPPESLAHLSSKATMSLSGSIDLQAQHSFYRQLMTLFAREVTSASRNKTLLSGRYGVPFVLSLLISLIFLDAAGGDNGDQVQFGSHYGAITMFLQASMMTGGGPVMITFPCERPVFLREYSTGSYGVVAYMLSKFMLEVPMTLLQVLEILLLFYFLLDMQGNFFFTWMAAWSLSMAASSAGLMLGCAAQDVKQATEVSLLIYVPQMLFCGFFIRLQLVPIFLQWAQYLCFYKYATNLVLMNEFRVGLPSCQTSDQARDNCSGVLDANDVNPDLFYVYILLLLGICVFFRLIGLFFLLRRAKRFY